MMMMMNDDDNDDDHHHHYELAYGWKPPRGGERARRDNCP